MSLEYKNNLKIGQCERSAEIPYVQSIGINNPANLDMIYRVKNITSNQYLNIFSSVSGKLGIVT